LFLHPLKRKLSDCWIDRRVAKYPTSSQLPCICSVLQQNGFVAHSFCAALALLRNAHVIHDMYVQNKAALKTRILSVADAKEFSVGHMFPQGLGSAASDLMK
jgi:hypothetical protein